MTVEAAQRRGLLHEGLAIQNARDFREAYVCLDGKNLDGYRDFFHCGWEIFANTPKWQETIVKDYFCFMSSSFVMTSRRMALAGAASPSWLVISSVSGTGNSMINHARSSLAIFSSQRWMIP